MTLPLLFDIGAGAVLLDRSRVGSGRPGPLHFTFTFDRLGAGTVVRLTAANHSGKPIILARLDALTGVLPFDPASVTVSAPGWQSWTAATLGAPLREAGRLGAPPLRGPRSPRGRPTARSSRGPP